MLRGAAVDMLSEQRHHLMTDQIARVAFILIALVFSLAHHHIGLIASH